MDDNPVATPFAISGTIHNDKNITVPPTAKLYAVWMVPDTPSYLYVFGEGAVDPASKTFTLTMPTAPPEKALNSNEIGVAYLMLIDEDLNEGEISDSVLAARILPGGEFYGSINDRAIVYVNGNPATVNAARPWISEFNFVRGYNLAKSWYNPDTTGFDGFRPDSGAVEIHIEPDPSKFSFPNWY